MILRLKGKTCSIYSIRRVVARLFGGSCSSEESGDPEIRHHVNSNALAATTHTIVSDPQKYTTKGRLIHKKYLIIETILLSEPQKEKGPYLAVGGHFGLFSLRHEIRRVGI